MFRDSAQIVSAKILEVFHGTMSVCVEVTNILACNTYCVLYMQRNITHPRNYILKPKCGVFVNPRRTETSLPYSMGVHTVEMPLSWDRGSTHANLLKTITIGPCGTQCLPMRSPHHTVGEVTGWPGNQVTGRLPALTSCKPNRTPACLRPAYVQPPPNTVYMPPWIRIPVPQPTGPPPTWKCSSNSRLQHFKKEIYRCHPHFATHPHKKPQFKQTPCSL